MSPSRRRWVVAASAVAALVACNGEGPPETEEMRGEWVTYHHSPEFVACGGNVRAADAFVSYAAGAMGLAQAEIPPVGFYWLTQEDFTAWLGMDCVGVLGCAGARGAFSLFPTLNHELAHVVGLGAGNFRGLWDFARYSR